MSRKAQGHFVLAIVCVAPMSASLTVQRTPIAFTIDQIKSYPSPKQHTAAS